MTDPTPPWAFCESCGCTHMQPCDLDCGGEIHDDGSRPRCTLCQESVGLPVTAVPTGEWPDEAHGRIADVIHWARQREHPDDCGGATAGECEAALAVLNHLASPDEAVNPQAQPLRSADPAVITVAGAIVGEDARMGGGWAVTVSGEHCWTLARLAVEALRAEGLLFEPEHDPAPRQQLVAASLAQGQRVKDLEAEVERLSADLDAARASAMPEMLTLEEARKVLRIGRTKAYSLARSGDFPLPVIRVGATYLIRRTDLVRLVRNEEPTAEPTPNHTLCSACNT